MTTVIKDTIARTIRIFTNGGVGVYGSGDWANILCVPNMTCQTRLKMKFSGFQKFPLVRHIENNHTAAQYFEY